MSKQWSRLLAERLDAIAVLHRVAVMVADADPHNDPMRVDHYRNGPYDMLLTPVSSTGQALSGGRTIGLIRQGPALPTSRLRYRLRSIELLEPVAAAYRHFDNPTGAHLKASRVRPAAGERGAAYWLP